VGSSGVMTGWSFEQVEERNSAAVGLRVSGKGERLRRTKLARFLRNAGKSRNWQNEQVCGHGADEQTNSRPN
jgi:hypothetical protein